MGNYLISGASKGIGFEIVSALLEEDHQVWAISRNVASLKELSKQTKRGHLHIKQLNLQDKEALLAFVEEVNIVFNGVVNNAGLLVNKAFEETNDEDWAQLIDVNLMAVIRLLRALKRNNCLKKGSHVVNISSMGGLQGSSKFAGLSAYSTTKGALSILTESLATEWVSSDISVNALCLGAVQTEMLAAAFPGFDAPVKAKQMGEWIANFLVNAAPLINGKILPIAGQDPS
jgi:NAD(P)-dependent dehydrogenase (short-subunit alcohol dehydrogenase family)